MNELWDAYTIVSCAVRQGSAKRKVGMKGSPLPGQVGTTHPSQQGGGMGETGK